MAASQNGYLLPEDEGQEPFAKAAAQKKLEAEQDAKRIEAQTARISNCKRLCTPQLWNWKSLGARKSWCSGAAPDRGFLHPLQLVAVSCLHLSCDPVHLVAIRTPGKLRSSSLIPTSSPRRSICWQWRWVVVCFPKPYFMASLVSNWNIMARHFVDLVNSMLESIAPKLFEMNTRRSSKFWHGLWRKVAGANWKLAAWTKGNPFHFLLFEIPKPDNWKASLGRLLIRGVSCSTWLQNVKWKRNLFLWLLLFRVYCLKRPRRMFKYAQSWGWKITHARRSLREPGPVWVCVRGVGNRYYGYANPGRSGLA